MAWTFAPALRVLRAQVDVIAPKRSKASDGTIGDAAHASHASDHNPNRSGVVCAWDCTAIPSQTFGENLANAIALDSRCNYVIYNHRIKSQGGSWRRYTGASPHTEHVHVSVRQVPSSYNSTRPWNLNLLKPKPAPKPAPAIIPFRVGDVLKATRNMYLRAGTATVLRIPVARIVGNIKAGDVVAYLGTSSSTPGWAMVRVKRTNQTGWMMSRLLTKG